MNNDYSDNGQILELPDGQVKNLHKSYKCSFICSKKNVSDKSNISVVDDHNPNCVHILPCHL